MPSPASTSPALDSAALASNTTSSYAKSSGLQWNDQATNGHKVDTSIKERNGQLPSRLGQGGVTGGSITNPQLQRPVLGTDEQARRPSIAFIPTSSEVALPSVVQAQKGDTKVPKRAGSKQRKMSSPPPPPNSFKPKGILKLSTEAKSIDDDDDDDSVFRPRVSFDTFDSRNAFIEENSFTLVRKHKDYEYTKRSRTFLIGLDSNDYSEYALEWLIEELVDDGDEIVALRVIDKDSDKSRGRVSIDTGRYKHEAQKLMNQVQEKNADNKAVNLILEFAVGKVNKVIADMINLYEPAILIVGTRGRSLGGFQGLLPGSVSKYCLQHSPVPVIVVRPGSKRAKVKRKRAMDPTRHGYEKLINRASIVGSGGSSSGLNSPTTATLSTTTAMQNVNPLDSSTALLSAPNTGTGSGSASGDASPLHPRSTAPLYPPSPIATTSSSPIPPSTIPGAPSITTAHANLDARNARNEVLDATYAGERLWGASTPTPHDEAEEAKAVAEAIGFRDGVLPGHFRVVDGHVVHNHPHASHEAEQGMEERGTGQSLERVTHTEVQADRSGNDVSATDAAADIRNDENDEGVRARGDGGFAGHAGGASEQAPPAATSLSQSPTVNALKHVEAALEGTRLEDGSGDGDGGGGGGGGDVDPGKT